MKGALKVQIYKYLMEDKLNATQIARIVGCHSGYVRTIKQRYITAPERERARAMERCRTPEYRSHMRKLKRKKRLDPAYRAWEDARKKEWRKANIERVRMLDRERRRRNKAEQMEALT